MKNGKGRKKKKKKEKGPGSVACLAFVAGLSSEVAEALAQKKEEEEEEERKGRRKINKKEVFPRKDSP